MGYSNILAIVSCWMLVVYAANGNIINSEVSRNIDLTTHLAKCQVSVTMENVGSNPIPSYKVPVDDSLSDNLAYIGASSKNDGDKARVLQVKEVKSSENKKQKVFEVKLDKSLNVGESATIEIEMVFSHALKPFPHKIGQSDKQSVIFEGNHYFLSTYTTKKQTTTVKLSSSTIESYSKLKPSSQSESTITYGPYEDVEPLEKSNMKIHYENNSPFLTVVNMVRTIEISHWGNIAVEETFHMRHTGAELKGTFSRYDYQRSTTHAVIKSFKSILPAAAADVYYRDTIGNISTSNLLPLDDSVELEIRPRFPLFGGWQTRFYMGYNVPSYEYMLSKGNAYQLKMRFIDHVYDDFLVDQFTLRIILPEGCKDLKMQLPYDAVEGQSELHHTYLDTFGRPVLVYHKNNLVEQHIQEFELNYVFNKILLLQEPLLLVGALYLLFLAVIVYVRLDFSITKDAVQEARLRAAGLAEELIDLLDQRRRFYSSYDDAVNKFKSSKDAASFMNSRKKIDSDYRGVSHKISACQNSLVKDQPESSDKLVELQRKETELKHLMDDAIVLAQKVVEGKINKQTYVDNEEAISARREKLSLEIESIQETL